MNQFFNDFTGMGDEGEIDMRGPWNEGGDWEFMTSPALSSGRLRPGRVIKTESSPPTAPDGMHDLLMDELRDILHAEKQLTKALPKMAKAARLTACANASKSILLKPKARLNGSMSAFRSLVKLPARNPAKV